VTVTLTRGAAATLLGGKFKLLRPTLEAAGKSMKTLSPNVPEFAELWLSELLYPFSAA
jgi:hypothetical protein